MRFTAFVGDGDSSACNNLCKLNGRKGPYTVPVAKEECVNHVSKRIGTRMHKIKKKHMNPSTPRVWRSRGAFWVQWTCWRMRWLTDCHLIMVKPEKTTKNPRYEDGRCILGVLLPPQLKRYTFISSLLTKRWRILELLQEGNCTRTTWKSQRL